MNVLNEAASYIRIQIGKRMRMRAVPHVKFLFDKSISRGRDLSSLIDQARDKDISLSDDESELQQNPETE